MKRKILFALLISMSLFMKAEAQDVRHAGAMRTVMHGGGTGPSILLDTIANRKGLYGLGPLTGLSGELMIIDGVIIASTAQSDDTMIVEERKSAGAPFFVYGHVNTWKKIQVPDSVLSAEELEAFIGQKTQATDSPFIFRIEAKAREARIHVMNVPEGAVIRSPEQAHQSQIDFSLENENITIIGFYSRRHKGIFTHHDRNSHMHLITNDHAAMGHLDEVSLVPGTITLYLAED